MRSAVSGYGEGSVFQRSDCKWVAKVCIGTDALGRAKVKQFTGKTEAIVYKKMKEYKSSTEFAMKKKPVRETVESYFTDWLVNSQYIQAKYCKRARECMKTQTKSNGAGDESRT